MSSSTSSDIVVEAKHLGKAYQLYAHRNDWLKQVLFGWWKAYFKPFWVLRDIDISVKRGESIGVLGRNGCGKSTLLQVICGMTLPSHGELRVSGRIAPVLALGSTFDQELTGRENVLIGGAVLGLLRPEVLAKFDSIVDFAGVGEFIDQPIKHYSTGMRARLAFALSFAIDFDCILIDEVLTVGDRSFQQRCYDELFVRRKHCAMIVAIHDAGFVREHCTAALILKGGRGRVFHDVSFATDIYNSL